MCIRDRIDTLRYNRTRLQRPVAFSIMGLKEKEYLLLTLEVYKRQVCILFIYQLKQKKKLWDDFRLFTKLKKQYTRHILKIGLPVAALNTLFAFVNMFLGRTATEPVSYTHLVFLLVFSTPPEKRIRFPCQ